MAEEERQLTPEQVAVLKRQALIAAYAIVGGDEKDRAEAVAFYRGVPKVTTAFLKKHLSRVGVKTEDGKIYPESTPDGNALLQATADKIVADPTSEYSESILSRIILQNELGEEKQKEGKLSYDFSDEWIARHQEAVMTKVDSYAQAIKEKYDDKQISEHIDSRIKSSLTFAFEKLTRPLKHGVNEKSKSFEKDIQMLARTVVNIDKLMTNVVVSELNKYDKDLRLMEADSLAINHGFGSYSAPAAAEA